MLLYDKFFKLKYEYLDFDLFIKWRNSFYNYISFTKNNMIENDIPNENN